MIKNLFVPEAKVGSIIIVINMLLLQKDQLMLHSILGVYHRL